MRQGGLFGGDVKQFFVFLQLSPAVQFCHSLIHPSQKIEIFLCWMPLPVKLVYLLSVVNVACPFPEDSSLSHEFLLVFLNGTLQNLSESSAVDTCLQIVAVVCSFLGLAFYLVALLAYFQFSAGDCPRISNCEKGIITKDVCVCVLFQHAYAFHPCI